MNVRHRWAAATLGAWLVAFLLGGGPEPRAARADDHEEAVPEVAPEHLSVQDEGLRKKLDAALADLGDRGGSARVTELLKQGPSGGAGAAAATPPQPSVKDLTGPELYRRLAESTVVLGARFRCKKCTRWHTSTASGFLVGADGLVATNYHVLSEEGKDPKDVILALDRHGVVYPVRALVATDPGHDLALLRIDGGPFTPLPLARTDPEAGEEIAVLSHPDGRFYLFTTGVISRMAAFADPRNRFLRAPAETICITAQIAPGSSGGPVTDRRGNVVGVAQRIAPIVQTPDGAGSRYTAMVIQMAVPVSHLRALIEKGGKAESEK
ncbi:MAG: trypsin-like peptidase domain-containing protein [Planctomycetes bacterium]|nr:trypsin-like peptidase domain-containing protein [Planctomycetota bacterium]